MSERRSRLLVVDASVVRSAGEAEHLVSSACRKCLEEIRRICHRVAVTPPIREEWNRHMSRFSRKWRRSMAARRKPLEPVVPANVPISVNVIPNSARVAIEKDMCLLEAALAADRIIVTRDESLQSALRQCPEGTSLLRSITWINPVTDGARAIKAL